MDGHFSLIFISFYYNFFYGMIFTEFPLNQSFVLLQLNFLVLESKFKNKLMRRFLRGITTLYLT